MRIKTIATLLPLAALLAACGTENRGLESVHQPVVQSTNYAFDLPYGSLTPGDQQNLSAWFAELRLGYGDRVAVDDRTGLGQAREQIAAVAAYYGILLSDAVPLTPGSDSIQGVRVVVSRSSATVPGCPDWSRRSQPEYKASGMSNYGCAMNSNLATMIADPMDLVQGREAAPGGDATYTSKAIKTYRSLEPTGSGNAVDKEGVSK
jgi:pilus assembly protein CpaD